VFGKCSGPGSQCESSDQCPVGVPYANGKGDSDGRWRWIVNSSIVELLEEELMHLVILDFIKLDSSLHSYV
jgi:hypothetical protein